MYSIAICSGLHIYSMKIQWTPFLATPEAIWVLTRWYKYWCQCKCNRNSGDYQLLCIYRMEIVLWGVVTSSLYFFCSRALAVYWVILSASTVISYTRADSIDGRMTRVERRLTSLEATLDKFMSTVSIRFKEILPKLLRVGGVVVFLQILKKS